MENKFEREVKFYPAWDKRNEGGKNYGVHGVDLTFYLRGPKGVVQFKVFTHWMLPEIEKEWEEESDSDFLRKPMPVDLGYHSPVPLYEGQQPMQSHCDVLNGQCYYDGSSLNAYHLFDRFLRGGSDEVWKELEEYYKHLFEEKENGQ